MLSFRRAVSRHPIPLGLALATNAIKAGYDAYRAVKSDPPFSTTTMPRSFNRSTKRTYRARKPMRTFRTKGMSINAVKRIVRSTAPTNSLTLTASTFAGASVNVVLSNVQTTDLTAIYRLYRIHKVVVHAVPRTSSANSGVVNNYQCVIAACCDPENTATPGGIAAITSYDNSHMKWITSDGHFKYTFYPKVTNSVDISGTSTGVGSYATNPWLRLDSTGITVPHLNLKLGVGTGASTNLVIDYYYDVHFDVKGIA